ncbi:DUF1292 domain-containing protein [Effusibacillus consociatus]|uniref:DUF1292 domain-containing protein n=1 Tax=Effusibacillus consociatus TaxID=1117041 RepID=A0ABV9Q894_9BACL
MAENDVRDYVTIEDAEGREKQYAIEALFDMDENVYALLSAEDETILMRVEGEGDEQYLVGITDPEEQAAIFDAYQIAVDAAPAE